MYLYQLKRGQRFTCMDPDLPGVLTFLGMDGMYGKVRHEDPELNRQLAARFGAGADFFAILAMTEVQPVET